MDPTEICNLFNSSSHQGDATCCTTSSPSASSKEKKILQARRQQRHSTEIGAEYHRWWVVRNALGFETNEHIAGLLLDGFHGLLQQLVVMCGGETYQQCIHGEAKSSCEPHDCCDDAAQSPSSLLSTSPPGGIENMTEFMEYQNSISHYCDSLWRLCCQQGTQLQQLDRTSQPVQEFLIRLMGYLRAAKGKTFSVNAKKKQFKQNNVHTRIVGENNSSQVSLAKPCPPISVAHREIPCVSVASVANQVILQDLTRLVKYQQGRPMKDTAASVNPTKSTIQAAQTRENNSVLPALCNGSGDKVQKSNNPMEYSFENLITNSNFQAHPTSATIEHKEKGNYKQENLLHPPFVNSQPEFLSEAQIPKPGQCHHPSQQQNIHLEQERTVLQHLLPTPHQSANAQKHSEVVREANQQLCKHSQQNETSCPQTEILTRISCLQQGLTSKDNKQQHKQLLPGQLSCLENKQTHGLAEDLSSHWWSNIKENCMYSGMGQDKELGERVTNRDCNFKMCANSSSLGSQGTEDKSVGELGFFLRDSLKMLPSIDEEVSDFPRQQGCCSDKGDGPQVKSLACQADLPMSLVSTPTADRQAQSSETSISMILPKGQPAVAALVTNRSQSLLNIPKQKAKETQTSTSYYNEIKINLNNPKRASEVKSQKAVSNTTLQPIQPAVFPGADKPPSLTTSLGTPVILYPARSFSSNDNSLASLASLVHNIVYSSYGTILKPLSLTSLPSAASYNSNQMIPPIPASAIDSSCQRKPIAAALPVLSSQLSTNKPTLVPFYISHAAVNTLGSFSKYKPLPGLASNTQNVPGLQLIPQSHCQQQTLESSTPSFSLGQNSIVSDLSPRAASDASQNLNQPKIMDVRSSSSSEFSGIKLSKNETLLPQVSYSNPGIFLDLDRKEMKSNDPIPFSQSTSVIKGRPSFINEQQFESLMKINSVVKDNIKPTESAFSYVCDQTECCPTGSRHENLQHDCANQVLSEYNAPSTKATSKILNSLLASKEVGVNGISDIGQAGNIMDSLESTCNTNKLMDSDCNLSHKSADEMSSLPQKENIPHISNEDISDEQPKIVKDSQCVLKPRSASMSSLSHKPQHHRRLVCPACNVFFSSSMDLLVHRFEQHGHVCGECDSRFLTLTRLKQHKEMDHPPVLFCSQCRFHTFIREDLAKHSWSEHRTTNKKEEEQLVQLTDTHHEGKEVNITSLNTVVAPKKFPTELLNLSLDTKETDICPSKIENVSDKTGSSDKTKESVSSTCMSNKNDCVQFFDVKRNDVSCTLILQSKVKCENEHQWKIPLNDNEFIKDSEQAFSGPVFPSFSRTVSDSARSDLDTISAMYTQVSQHCQLDTTDFLNTSDLHLSENEEPRLVIDTDFGCIKGECKDEQQEKSEQNDETGIGFCSNLRIKSEDKSCGPGSKKGRMRRKRSGRNNSLCKSEIVPSLVKRLGVNNSNNRQQSDGNLTVDTGKDQKRLVMNIKRRNTTPGCDGQSQKRKRKNNGDGGACGGDSSDDKVKSTTDSSLMKMSSQERLDGGFYISKSSVGRNKNNCNISKSSVSRNSNNCNEASVRDCCLVNAKSGNIDNFNSSCDKVYKNYDKTSTYGSICDKVSAITCDLDNYGSNCDKVSKRIDMNSTYESSCDKVSAITCNLDNYGSNCDKVSKRIDMNSTYESSCDKVSAITCNLDNYDNNCDKVSKRIDKTSTYESSCDKVSAVTCNLDNYDNRCDNISVRSDNINAIINSCDKVSALTVNTNIHDNSCRIGFCQMTLPTGDSGSQRDESISASFVSVQADSAGKQVNQESSNLQEKLNMNPSPLMCAANDECGGFRAPTVSLNHLPLQEYHVMSFLLPNKKKRKKSLGPSGDLSSGKQPENNLQVSNDSSVKTNQFNDISERTSLAIASIQVSQATEKTCEKDELGRSECKDNLINDKKSVATSPARIENKVQSEITRSESANCGQVGNVVGRRFECPVSSCNVTFCRRWNMKDHMMKVHAQSPLIVCSVAGCDLKFSNKRELRQHVTIDHMGKTRKHMCNWPECSKGFFARTHLSIHMLTHTGEKPVACNICDYRCRQRTALIWHLRKHGVFHKTEKTKNVRNSTPSEEGKIV